MEMQGCEAPMMKIPMPHSAIEAGFSFNRVLLSPFGSWRSLLCKAFEHFAFNRWNMIRWNDLVPIMWGMAAGTT